MMIFWETILCNSDLFLDATLGLVNKSRYSSKEGKAGQIEKKVCFQVLDLRSGLKREIIIHMDLISSQADS